MTRLYIRHTGTTPTNNELCLELDKITKEPIQIFRDNELINTIIPENQIVIIDGFSTSGGCGSCCYHKTKEFYNTSILIGDKTYSLSSH